MNPALHLSGELFAQGLIAITALGVGAALLIQRARRASRSTPPRAQPVALPRPVPAGRTAPSDSPPPVPGSNAALLPGNVPTASLPEVGVRTAGEGPTELHGPRRALGVNKSPAVASDPSERRTEAISTLDQYRALTKIRGKTPAPSRRTPPPPPVPTAELPAPSKRVLSPFFTQTTREDLVPPDLIRASVPPSGPVTDEHDAPSQRSSAAAGTVVARRTPAPLPATSIEGPAPTRAALGAAAVVVREAPRFSAESTREVAVPRIVRPQPSPDAIAVTAESPAPVLRSGPRVTPPKTVRKVTPPAGSRLSGGSRF